MCIGLESLKESMWTLYFSPRWRLIHSIPKRLVTWIKNQLTRSFSEFHYNKRKEVAYTIVLSYMYTPVAVEDDAIWETTFFVL